MDANPKSPTFERLEDQISWYDKKSAYNQSWFKRIKIIELIAAALIPFLAGFSTKAPQEATYYAIATGGLGALIVLLESMQGLYCVVPKLFRMDSDFIFFKLFMISQPK